MAENLMEGLLSQMNRVREIVKVYEEVEGGAGMFAAAMMKASIMNTEKAIASDDVIEMMRCYTDLEGYEL